MNQRIVKPQPIQRIIKMRRDYNRWVSDETLEDYALRFTPRSFRKWSEFRVANTAFGAVSFLALEAIGAAITLSYGFTNAMWAIGVVSLIIFLTGLPIAYHAARNGLDMDLLARGAGFGYLGSTITSLIYASFTFIFFAIEAAIMAQAFDLWFGMPRSLGYLLSALIVLPLVTHGVTLISRLQLWTQPLWIVLLLLPFVAVAIKDPGAFVAFSSLNGSSSGSDEFSWAAFGAAATVAASLIAQIGEQVDFLRFMPEPKPGRKAQWWLAVIIAGPGWIVLGAAKMIGGAFLAFLVLQYEIPLARALEPTQMYLIGFGEAVGNNAWAVFLTGLFVIVSQVKINITNAYAGSLAWSNFFARLTHSHPGRVVWLVFNVLIAVLLMVMGVFEAIEQVLGLYAHLAVAWVGAVVSDLVISKPLGLSPRNIEFRRAYLYDINPAGFGAMLIASMVSVAVYSGLFGDAIRPASAGLALLVSLLAAPLISLLTGQRYTIARTPDNFGPRHRVVRCTICRNKFEADDMAHCPAYGGSICSLCCTLDARCGDRCKTGSRAHEQLASLIGRWLPDQVSLPMTRRIWQYALVLSGMVCVFGAMLWLLYEQELLHPGGASSADLSSLFWKVFSGLFLLTAVSAWWLVLANESKVVAQEESDHQNLLLQQEIDAHRQTDAALQKAKEVAESASLAKSRFVTGMSHEMRSPLNSILGYSQVILRRQKLDPMLKDSVSTIHRSGEHLASLVDGLLELSRIEAGKLRLEQEALWLEDFLLEIVRMFRPLAEESGLHFHYEINGHLPQRVHADPKRLRQILINLLSNAIKFTQAGSVSLRVRYQREILHIEVIDTGVGIAPGDHELIFLPFERGSGGAGIEGTGLGLTITRLLVDLMGGDIQLHSQVGQGSCFSIRLYLPALPDISRDALLAPVAGYSGPRRHLLVVDDQPDHRHMLRAMLGPLGFTITEASSGPECLAAMQQEDIDLILLDINLTDTTGWALCQALREAGHAQPVIMVSANAHENTPHILAEHAVQGFVIKPVSEPELLDALQQALDINWLRIPQTSTDKYLEPAPEILRELLGLSAGKYHRALRARLIELGDEAPELKPWVLSYLPLLDLDDHHLTQRLSQALHNHAFN